MTTHMPLEQLLMVSRLLVLILLFFFASQVIRVLRRGLPHPTTGPVGRAVLQVVAGDPRLRPGQQLALGQRSTLGRAPDNTIVLADRHASRHHARISWQAADCLVQDLNSKAGTRVDGKPVGPQGKLLAVGGTLAIGRVEFRRVQ